MGKYVPTLILVLVLLIIGYLLMAMNDPTLKGGFIATATYLIKKLADQIEEMIDQEYKIKNTPVEPVQGGTDAKT